MEINSITDRYIFYSDGTSQPVNHERLVEILPIAIENTEYFARLRADMMKLFDMQCERLDSIKIDFKPRNIAEEIHKQQKIEEYTAQYGVLTAYHNVYENAFDMLDKWITIKNTIENLLTQHPHRAII